MLEYLRDPAWQFVGAILALVAILATIGLFLLQRQRKRLAYDVVSKNQLLTVKEELESKLRVFYDGQATRDICLLVIKVTNNGNVAIASADYERQLSISTGVRSKILSAAITEVEPRGLEVNLSVDESIVKIAPTLLNPHDSITIKLIVSDFPGRVAVDARIIGVKRVERVGISSVRQSVLILTVMVGMLVGLLMAIHYGPPPEMSPPTRPEAKIGIGLFVTSYVAMGYLMLKNRLFKNIVRILVRAVRKK